MQRVNTHLVLLPCARNPIQKSVRFIPDGVAQGVLSSMHSNATMGLRWLSENLFCLSLLLFYL